MGQRSQIYVRFNRADGRKFIIPRYYQWNYAERMLSRAKGIIEWLEEYGQTPDLLVQGEYNEKLKRIMDTNFDYRDIVLGHDLINEYYEAQAYQKKNGLEPETFEQAVIAGQDNNDGQLFIDMIVDFDHRKKNGDYKVTFKYAFRTLDDEDWTPKDPEQYMDWDYSDWRTSEYMKDAVNLTKRNIRWIRKHGVLMTSDEMYDFAHYDYPKDMDLKGENNGQ